MTVLFEGSCLPCGVGDASQFLCDVNAAILITSGNAFLFYTKRVISARNAIAIDQRSIHKLKEGLDRTRSRVSHTQLQRIVYVSIIQWYYSTESHRIDLSEDMFESILGSVRM